MCCFVTDLKARFQQVASSLICGHNQCSGSLKLELIYSIYTNTNIPTLYISLKIYIFLCIYTFIWKGEK